jgi:histidine triad (HIT) family protein
MILDTEVASSASRGEPMQSDAQCIFCRIVRGEIPGAIVHQDEQIVAFRDIQPAAPVHVLVVPREHITSLAELGARHVDLAAALLLAVNHVATAEGLAENGYRVISNVGSSAGQTVHHLHFHVLGGRTLGALG